MEDQTGRALAPWPNHGEAMEPTCSPPRTPARRTIPRAIHEIVGELKVRFQHGSGGDPEGFRARTALLAEDLADVPAELLRVAAAAWVREHPFLPTAADLTRLMREELEQRDRASTPSKADTRTDDQRALAFCDERNAALATFDHPRRRDGIEWFVDGGGAARLRFVPRPAVRLASVHPGDVPARNASLQRSNATFRYDADGCPRDLTFAEEDARLAAGGASPR